jgi:rhamnose utilization protein RhaD (predicted bifunctional aldolase and dehydrogenase)/NAD(P)-dependent dehydrogenase (short-subunit alcohol dehydrogenase family)
MPKLFHRDEADAFAKQYPDVPKELAYQAYTSRLLGADPCLVLHGGGNASVKLRLPTLLGHEQDVLYVKARGTDMAHISPSEFTGLDLARLTQLKSLEQLDDEEMERQLRLARTDPDAPDPSVEALLHAFLPYPCVDHTHSDAVLILSHLENGTEMIQAALGPKAVVMDYAASGLPLAKAAAQALENTPDAEALVVLHHGVFTFGPDAQTSHARMLDYTGKAEQIIEQKTGQTVSLPDRETPPAGSNAARVASTIRGLCAHAGPEGHIIRFLTEVRTTPELIELSLSPDAREMCRSGVLTPDHAIRTRNRYLFLDAIPKNDSELQQQIIEKLAEFRRDQGRYCGGHGVLDCPLDRLDNYPRVVLAAGTGLIALGATRREARMAADIAEQTLRAKVLTQAISKYVPMPEEDVHHMEFWGPQQKKLRTAPPRPLQGKAALVTGAAGAIGYGIADRLLASGAAVMLCDLDSAGLNRVRDILAERYSPELVGALAFDVTDFAATETAFTKTTLLFGGLDIVVPNAGLAHVDRLESLDSDRLRLVAEVNLMGTFHTVKAAIPLLRRQGTGGDIVLISTKNVFDPGAAFGAYSSTKAAAHQLAKIAALELAELGVRVNMINPDAVFGDEHVPSKLWELIGPDRMKARGLDPEGLKEYYRQRNMLKAPVTAEHVGNVVVFFCSELTPTTGATMPVDGGGPGAFPR